MALGQQAQVQLTELALTLQQVLVPARLVHQEVEVLQVLGQVQLELQVLGQVQPELQDRPDQVQVQQDQDLDQLDQVLQAVPLDRETSK